MKQLWLNYIQNNFLMAYAKETRVKLQFKWVLGLNCINLDQTAIIENTPGVRLKDFCTKTELFIIYKGLCENFRKLGVRVDF